MNDEFINLARSFYYSDKYVFESLSKEDKLKLISAYMNCYVDPWGKTEAIYESKLGEDLPYLISNMLNGCDNEYSLVDKIKEIYLEYYENMVGDKFDDYCIHLCNTRCKDILFISELNY